MLPFNVREAATLPRSFRLRVPSTPEPLTDELRQPSPPRPVRLKVRRRIASSFAAPTESFLASVAAADAPYPSIELTDATEDVRDTHASITPGLLEPNSFRTRDLKTPEPSSHVAVDELTRPDWYKSITPDPERRPGTACSERSISSDDTCCGSLASHHSEDGSCTSPDSDVMDPFGPPSFSKSRPSTQRVLPTFNQVSTAPASRDARPLWTREMSAHVWATYSLYLQDPTVTPFVIGASGIPPEGICRRVAREAKRSWKRKTSRRKMLNDSWAHDLDPRSIEKPWPHSEAATRAHLRELCKRRANNLLPSHRFFHTYHSSPLAEARARLRARNRYKTPEPTSAPEPPANSFLKDLGLSLATSTADSMQPDGPLAQLTAGVDMRRPDPTDWIERTVSSRLGPRTHARQLSAPFRYTYGPSASTAAVPLFDPLELRKQPDTISTSRPRLGSPVRFQPRSQHSTKRRAKLPLDEELTPSGASLRPSILDDQLFGPPLDTQPRRIRRTRGFTMGDEGFLAREQDAAHDFATFARSLESGSLPTHTLLPSAMCDPPRFGSLDGGAGNTFPRRAVQPEKPTRGGPFATVRPHRSTNSVGSAAPSLQSRLRSLDQRLQDMAQPDTSA